MADRNGSDVPLLPIIASTQGTRQLSAKEGQRCTPAPRAPLLSTMHLLVCALILRVGALMCTRSRTSSTSRQNTIGRETSRHGPDKEAKSRISRRQSSSTTPPTTTGGSGASLPSPGSSHMSADNTDKNRSIHRSVTPADALKRPTLLHSSLRVPSDLSAVVSVECRNLKGPTPLAKVDVRCVVSVGEYEYCYGKRKNFRWEVIGETETVPNNRSPEFETTIEVTYNWSKSRLLKFDLFGSTNDVEAMENFHIGAYVCEVQDLLKRPSWAVDGTLIKKGKVDNSHVRFEVTRHLREVLTPAQMMEIFKSVDLDTSLSLSAQEFKNAIRFMAKKGGFHMSREQENWAWEIGDEDKTGSVDYAEFVSMVWGAQGLISVTIEDRQNVSAEKHANMLFNKFRRSVTKKLGRELGQAVEPVELDTSTYEREAHRDTQARALRLLAGMRDSHVLVDRQNERLREIEESADMPQVVDKAVLVESRPPCKPLEWDRRAKGRGVIVTKGHNVAVATCNLMNDNAGPCSVRSSQPLAAGVTYFELAILRDEHMHDGASLDGPYAVGLATNAMDKFDGSWTHPNVHPACFALVSINPPEYEARWSLRHKAPAMFVHGVDNHVCTCSEEAMADRGHKRSMISNIRAQRALPRGSSYFEVTIKAAGRCRGESLGGDCHIGLCSENMSSLGWIGKWTDGEDPRKDEAWTLCDNYNGQLSTSIFGMKATDKMSEREMLKTMHMKFEQFDKDNSGTIDWNELHDALKEMSICCQDHEMIEMLTALGLEEGESIHFEEFVLLIRSRAATGTLFHGEKSDWCLNSFFGVGDTIGFSVDTVAGSAAIFKNGIWLGQAFLDLPEVVYPFVSLPKAGISATISVDSSKGLNPKSDLFTGGFRKPWIEGSHFGAADRIGFLLDTKSKTCDVYKNGRYLGRAFERLPPNLFPFATLCHSGAKACLSFPPQPNPWCYQHMKAVLAESKYCVTKDIPCDGGYMDLSETGTPCGIKLQVLAGGEHQRGERRFVLQACDIESLFDCDVLGGTVPARIVSPVVQVVQKSGPEMDEPQTKLSIPHCCAQAKGLKLVYMPGQSAGSSAHHNVWAEMDATWSSRQGTCSIRGSGIFCVICLDDPLDNPDMMHIECRLFNSQQKSRQNGQMVDLDRIPGARIPKFCCIPLGTSIDGIITLRTISAVDVCDHEGQDAIDTRMPRGSQVDALSAVAYDADGQHCGEELSDTVCFATCGCALWMQSLFAFKLEKSGKLENSARKLMQNYLTGNSDNMIKVINTWKGSPLELPFKIRTERLQDDVELARGVLLRRMGWNSMLEAHDWKQFSYLFDPSNGMLFEGSRSEAIVKPKTSSFMPLVHQNAERDLRKGIGLQCLGQLPSMRFEAGSNPNSLLRHLLILQPSQSAGAGPSNDRGERGQEWGGAAGVQGTGASGPIPRENNAIVLASGHRQDRDLFLNNFRQFVARNEGLKHLQQVSHVRLCDQNVAVYGAVWCVGLCWFVLKHAPSK